MSKLSKPEICDETAGTPTAPIDVARVKQTVDVLLQQFEEKRRRIIERWGNDETKNDFRPPTKTKYMTPFNPPGTPG